MIAGENTCSLVPPASSRRSACGLSMSYFAMHPRVGVVAGLLQDRLIVLRQRVPLVEIDEGEQHRAAFPPARRIVVRRDLVEAELLVVVGPDPFGSVDRALLQRRIDVAGRRSAAARRRASAGRVPAQPPMRIFRPLRSSTVLISLRNQPPIWQPVLPASSASAVVLLVELVQHVLAAALRPPSLGSGARWVRTAPRCRSRRSGPCRNSNTTRCGRSRRCRSAPHRRSARPGTISPAAKIWIWNLLSVASATALHIISAPP